ncbi:MAG: hypothetical protein LUC83_03225, partial [Clostridiales bacterium]|nr:hypothetical protein [Clostridiales bacterium]
MWIRKIAGKCRKRRLFFREHTGKKIRFRLLLLFIACMVLSLEIGYLKKQSAAAGEKAGEKVLTAELAGYLQILPFSPEETRAWLLPDMGTYLTGADVDLLLDFLEVESFSEELHEEISFTAGEELSREKWCLIYEKLTEYLGLSEQMQVVTICYLGMLEEQSRVMADNGNYDCDPASINFIYGETCEVYITGNLLLGRRVSAEAETDSETTNGEQDLSVEVSVPDTVRVLLTQDNNAAVYRENVKIRGTGTLRLTSGDQSCEAAAETVTDCAKLMEEWGVSELIAETDGEERICVVNEEGSAVSSYYRGSFHLYQNESGIWIV